MDHSKHKKKKGYDSMYGKRSGMSVAGDVRTEEPYEKQAKKKKKKGKK